MRILTVGAGAVGGYVGGRLAQAGRDVEFLVRPGRAARLRDEGLRIVGAAGTDVVDARPVTAADLAGPYDLVLVGVKAQSLQAAIEDFRPAVGARTAVVPFLNGINHIDVLVAVFGRPAVLGGVLRIVTQLDADGAIRELAPGGSIQIGELDATASERADSIAECLAVPGFDVSVPANIVDAMWSKWVFIATIGAVTSLAHGSIGEVVATPGGAAFAENTLAEAASVVKAAGHELGDAAFEAVRKSVTTPGAPTTSSLSRDLVAGQPTEVDAVIGDLIDLAHASQLPVARLEAAALVLRAHDARLARARTGR